MQECSFAYVLYGFEILCVILREECRVGMCEGRVFRIIFEPNRDEVTGGGEKCMCTLQQVRLELSSRGG
jgi:hypothetical protein